MKQEPKLDKSFYIVGWIGIILLLALGLVVAFAKRPLTELAMPCLFNHFTGYYCPGCGGTRAASLLIHGHLLQSCVYHPAVIYTVVVAGWFMISQTIGYLTKGKFKYVMHVRMIYIYICIAIIILNWIVKNVFILAFGIYLLS